MIHNNIGRGSLLWWGWVTSTIAVFSQTVPPGAPCFYGPLQHASPGKHQEGKNQTSSSFCLPREPPGDDPFRLCIWFLCKTCFTAQPSLKDATQETCHPPEQPEARAVLTFYLRIIVIFVQKPPLDSMHICHHITVEMGLNSLSILTYDREMLQLSFPFPFGPRGWLIGFSLCFHKLWDMCLQTNLKQKCQVMWVQFLSWRIIPFA